MTGSRTPCLALALSILLLAGCDRQDLQHEEELAGGEPPRVGSARGEPEGADSLENTSRRMFGYNLDLLPNRVLAENEKGVTSLEEAVRRSGETIGYPAWNLLYYSVLCSLDRESVTIVETGTNVGFSTVVLAQALKDSGADGLVHTVDINEDYLEIARKVVERAGLTDYVRFHRDDSLAFLRRFVESHDEIDFVFLDALHTKEHVVSEFEIIFERVRAGRGKVYFDNTRSGGVHEALEVIRARYGGNLVEFENASWWPPGNVIWQAD
jgi:predicted O-methyltransferase YrrM